MTHEERIQQVEDRAGARRHSFGQSIAAHRLGPLACQIASGIGDGTPALWAGFVWYRPEGLFQQSLIPHPVKVAPPAA
jgi:hypothetical protein